MKDFFKSLLIFQLLTLISILLNISIIRQVFGFISLSIVPGYLFLKIFKINLKDKSDTVYFSVGMSICCLMFIGLLINVLYPLIGVNRPLTFLPLLSTYTFLNFFLIFLARNEDNSDIFYNISFFKKSIKNYFMYVFIGVLPFLSVIGAIYQLNYILILMIFLISLLFIIIGFKNDIISKSLYPFLIFSVTFSLLMHTSLISEYILGYDVNIEYHVYKTTEINGVWNPFIFKPKVYRNILNFNSMLSITILPTIFSTLLKIRDDMVLKIIFPTIFSFVPIILYKTYEKQTSTLISLFSVFFLITDFTIFFGVYPINLCRQIIAQLFFTLTILLLSYDKIEIRKRKILLIIFGTALIVSHYATSYVFLFYLILGFIFNFKNNDKNVLSAPLITFLTFTKLTWDVFISIDTVRQINRIIYDIYNRFILDFFNPITRSPDISRLLSPSTSIVNQLHKMIFYAVHLLLFIGIINLLIQPKKEKIDPQYRIFSLLAICKVFVILVTPNITNFYKLMRFRTFAMLFLSIYIFIGNRTIFGWIDAIEKVILRDRSSKLFNVKQNNLYLKLLTLILVFYFFFNVGFVNYITEDKPISISLDIERMKTASDLQVKTEFYTTYIQEHDYFSTIWLSNNYRKTKLIYADWASRWHVLHSYGIISGDQTRSLRNTTVILRGEYLYLSHLNAIEGIVATPSIDGSFAYPISEISLLLSENNKIYTNGDSEIYSGF